MICKWNIVSEILQRESGYADHSGIYSSNSNLFNKSISGSWFLVQHLKEPHIVGNKCGANSLNFNRNGELLCIGYYDNQIAIYDWAHNKMKYSFDSNHTEDPSDVKFLNIDENSFDIISTSYDGQIRRALITPTGEVISTLLYQYKYATPTLAEVPGSPYEFIGVTTRGSLFQMDLRCSNPICSSVANIPNKSFSYLELNDVAHHPFSPEFCIAADDAFLRVYDKRNLNECVQKMCRKTLEHPTTISQCSYNYNGNEILANYIEEGAYLFNSRNYTPGEYLSCYRSDYGTFYEVEFFGPKSEFIICGSGDGINFFDKTSNRTTKIYSISEAFIDTDDDSISDLSALHFYCGVRPHPFLPVIASKTSEHVIIWAPKNK